MYVLITGGSGNLARYCLEEFRTHGHEVTLFDRVRPEGARSPWSTSAPFVLGELTSREDCIRAAESARAEAVVHLGGIPHPSEVPYVAGKPEQAREPIDETFRVNVLGTYYILDAARHVGALAVAFASTMSTLGISPRLGKLPIPVRSMPVDESHPFWSENTYSLSKVLNEETLVAFGRAYSIRAVAFRMMHVYMPHGGADAPFNPRLGQPAPPLVPGNFAAWEYLDARDAAAAYRLAVEATHLDLFEPMFLATDRTSREEHRELAARSYPHLREQAERMGQDDLILSIRRARERLGYAPRHSWRGPEANARVN